MYKRNANLIAKVKYFASEKLCGVRTVNRSEIPHYAYTKTLPATLKNKRKMIDLYVYGRKTNNIFDMLGTKENDISYAIGLGFSKAPQFLKLYLEAIGIKSLKLDRVKIKLQEFEKSKGFTDFEIEQEGEFIVIIEAKKGWNFPGQNQLDKYSSRPSFINFTAQTKKLVVFTESKKDFTQAHFHIKQSNSFEVEVTSYRQLWEIAQKAKLKSNNYEKRFLDELINYLEKLMTMKNIYSNLVYVVAVSTGQVKGWKISWIDIVKRKKIFSSSWWQWLANRTCELYSI